MGGVASNNLAAAGEALAASPTAALRRLTVPQRRYLARLPEGRFNVLSIEGCRLTSVRTLDGLGLIERGRCGLHDARLTPLGRQARALLRGVVS